MTLKNLRLLWDLRGHPQATKFSDIGYVLTQL
jgi:hypothetical protein